MKLRDILTEVVKPGRKSPQPTADWVNTIGSTDDGPTANLDKQLAVQKLMRSHKIMRDVVNDISTQPEHKFVGAGINAYVHRTDNQHSLDQVHRTAKPNEGTTLYLDFLRTHPKLYNNTFFPRVKGVRSLHSNTTTMDIERLKPFNTPGLGDNVELLLSLWERYYKWRVPIQLKGESDSNYRFDIQWKFLHNLNDVIKYGSGTADPQLTQAYKIIDHLRSKHDQVIDIHSGNVMWRLTGVGPQLVITDPMWGGPGSLDPVKAVPK